jgi:DNA-binding protein H-NS
MAKVNLTNMDVPSLLSLRKQVDEALADRRTELEKQLRELGGSARGRQAASKLKGRKVEPKYRSRSGETWAGRGAKPRWLAEAIKAGHSPEDFLIERPPAVAKKGKKRRVKK